MSCEFDRAEIANRFDFHPADTDGKIIAHREVRDQCEQLALFLYDHLPKCRETTRALTAVEDAMFNANAAIARHWEGD